MKILFLGEISPGQTSLMRMRALKRLGQEVAGVHTIEPWQRASWLQRQVQRRIRRGSIVDEINRQVLQAARDFRPSLVWAEKQEYLRRDTLEAMRAMGVRCWLSGRVGASPRAIATRCGRGRRTH